VPPSAQEIERALSRLPEFSHPNWAFHLRELHEATLQYEKCSPAEFLNRLQENLERIASYDRLLRLLRAMMKFAALFRLQND